MFIFPSNSKCKCLKSHITIWCLIIKEDIQVPIYSFLKVVDESSQSNNGCICILIHLEKSKFRQTEKMCFSLQLKWLCSHYIVFAATPKTNLLLIVINLGLVRGKECVLFVNPGRGLLRDLYPDRACQRSFMKRVSLLMNYHPVRSRIIVSQLSEIQHSQLQLLSPFYYLCHVISFRSQKTTC